jgi:hypothetical protein
MESLFTSQYLGQTALYEYLSSSIMNGLIKAPSVKYEWGKNVSPAVCIANYLFRTVKCGQIECSL